MQANTSVSYLPLPLEQLFFDSIHEHGLTLNEFGALMALLCLSLRRSPPCTLPNSIDWLGRALARIGALWRTRGANRRRNHLARIAACFQEIEDGKLLRHELLFLSYQSAVARIESAKSAAAARWNRPEKTAPAACVRIADAMPEDKTTELQTPLPPLEKGAQGILPLGPLPLKLTARQKARMAKEAKILRELMIGAPREYFDGGGFERDLARRCGF